MAALKDLDIFGCRKKNIKNVMHEILAVNERLLETNTNKMV